MAYSLQQILGWAPLTETLRTTSQGVPNPFPKELFSVSNGNRVLGDRARSTHLTADASASTMRPTWSSVVTNGGQKVRVSVPMARVITPSASIRSRAAIAS